MKGRRALGALFAVLTVMFAGIAFSARRARLGDRVRGRRARVLDGRNGRAWTPVALRIPPTGGVFFLAVERARRTPAASGASTSRSRDQAVRDRLILTYAPLVKYVAGRLGSGLPAHVDEGDLVSYGLLGLIGAIERYDPDRDVKFETYAIARIKGSIIDELRAMDWVPRSVRSRAREIERAIADLESKLGGRRATRRSRRSSASPRRSSTRA